ncbi:MAG TPA: CBS domain-containing protein [Solirubrobacteraceae bacterium]|nr:CBS domain-containing protein [Solirubrobacteraceae bacterium]
MTQKLLHLSAVLKSPLVDRSGDRLGRVEDLIVRLADGGFPPVTGIKARIGGRDLFVPADRVASLAADRVALSGERLDLRRFERREGEVLLREDVLGHTLIDVESARLVTAQEIELTCVDGWWRVVAINPSGRVRLRRMLPGWQEGQGGEGLLDWTRLEPFVGHVPSSRLRIGHRKLARLHPAQIADLVEAASHDEGEEIIEAVGHDRELEADVFEELDDEHQLEFIRERSDAQAAMLLGRMATDDAADLVAELDQERREPILALLPVAQQRRIRTLLGYNPSTAGGLMSPDFVSLPEKTTVREAIARVRDCEIAPEAAATVFVFDEARRLSGSLPVAALLRSDDDQPLSAAAEHEPQRVFADADLPYVANLMSDFNLAVLPVIDENETLVGVVTVDDVLDQVLPAAWRRRHRVVHG